MAYVDVFVMPVPKDRVEDYKRLAQQSATLWREYGATNYVEAIGDDVPYGALTSFPRAVQVKDGETVAVSWLTYPSKGVRDAANKQMMDDPRMKDMMDKMPTDGERMIFGGFETFIG